MTDYEEPPLRLGPIGNNIFRIRRKLRITQKQLASPEFSVSYISAIERGRIRPSLKALDILARRLGVTSAELLAELPEGAEAQLGYGLRDETAPPPSLTTLLSQRRTPYLTSLIIIWASISLSRRNPQLASEILDLLPLNAISAEQRLLLLYMRGRVALVMGRPADAQAILEPVLRQDEFSGHTELLERCRFLLACAYEAQDKFLLASDTFTACVQAIENGLVGDPLFAIEVYSTLAEHHRLRERREAAVACCQRALSFFDFVLEPARLADISAQLSQKHLENIHSTLADWYAARSRALLELAEARQRFTQAASNLGLIWQDLGKPQDAEQQFRQTIDFSAQLGTRRQAILARIALADLLLERQGASEAERLALEAQALSQPGEQANIEDEILYGRVLTTLADASRALNRLDEAEDYFQQATRLLKKHNASEPLSHAYYRYSELLHQKGMDAESYEMVRQAYLLDQNKHHEQTDSPI